MTHRILFVCLGNICRSPSAEAVVQSMAQALGVPVALDSAGTGGWHAGEPPYPPMQAAGKRRGYDLSALRARQVTVQDFDRFDLIVAMDDQNLADLMQMRPANPQAALCKFTDFARDSGATHVPDPYYTRDFDGSLDLIEACAKGLLDDLAQRGA